MVISGGADGEGIVVSARVWDASRRLSSIRGTVANFFCSSVLLIKEAGCQRRNGFFYIENIMCV